MIKTWKTKILELLFVFFLAKNLKQKTAIDEYQQTEILDWYSFYLTLWISTNWNIIFILFLTLWKPTNWNFRLIFFLFNSLNTKKLGAAELRRHCLM